MPEIQELHRYPSRARMHAFQVISVWGISGSGKSTLVKHLYKKVGHKKEFCKHAWLDVSCSFNLRDFCQSLLLQLNSCSLEGNEPIYVNEVIRDPVQECHDILKNERCLVVIDNMQSGEDWDMIEDALIFRPSESVVIVITNEELALHWAGTKDLVFNVKGL
jgi:energy-coupling factor transporter ATP-binding protein EcfA2